jgi:hypothetical protein
VADNPIILLHPVREPLDQMGVGALELLARMMLPMDIAERTLFWEGIAADIVSKGLLRFARIDFVFVAPRRDRASDHRSPRPRRVDPRVAERRSLGGPCRNRTSPPA